MVISKGVSKIIIKQNVMGAILRKGENSDASHSKEKRFS